MATFNPLIEVQSDSLLTPVVRQWSLEKYKLVGSYCDIFTRGMRNKWEQLVYIDLFAGAGYAKIEETKRSYLSSSLIAMSVPIPFDKYILCEQDSDKFDALSKRVTRLKPELDVTLINGDSNIIIDQVISSLPKFNKGNKMLTFCFVDPYSLNFSFDTINALGSKLLVDYLILHALHMDANRNLNNYIKLENEKIANYLGDQIWREKYLADCKENSTNFVKFLNDRYQEQMTSIGYQNKNLAHQIKSNEKNLPLYYLSFYSKHPRGIDFYKKVEANLTPQLKFDLS